MLIADNKKNKNIAEYIIYLWQTEELIRSYDLDITRIKASIVEFLPIEEQEKLAVIDWYAKLIDAMKQEGVHERGHLHESKAIIDELNALHHLLLDVMKDVEYTKLISQAMEKIDTFRQMATDKHFSVVEVFLNALYGFLLLRLNNKPVDDEMKKLVDQFGLILSYLSYKYKERMQGRFN